MTSIYFAVRLYLFKSWTRLLIFIYIIKGVMVRLMLVLAPVMCILSGIGISSVLTSYMKNLDTYNKQDKKSKNKEDGYPKKSEVRAQLTLFIEILILILNRLPPLSSSSFASLLPIIHSIVPGSLQRPILVLPLFFQPKATTVRRLSSTTSERLTTGWDTTLLR